MESLPFDMPEFAPGSVWLVGAGPGDPGLISLLGYHALRHADAVVYDALVDSRLLQAVRAGAIVEYAGKRGGKPSPKQRDISLRLVELARAGHRVLRLKGGDPFVFGRGGEEALTLVGADIPFRVVPGISAGVGGLAYAGIPVTHRDVNQAVTFVTGHGVTGDVPDGLDCQGLAKGSPVLVFYMALKHLGTIAANLIASGRNPAEAAAIVVRASLPDQRVLETTLGAAARDASAQDLRPPGLFVVGDVVRLRAGLDWLGAMAHNRRLDADPLRNGPPARSG
ncbi:MAG: uroporphyrinogen-III C-methyltransferase [Alphaproteobacteria bacterium]|nr:uroporphyrinogen-III C-methyltransferase [Alphaproteobacteria bacterium]